ncbi:unnamed protein product [Schistocephalus solidus]|uniref:Transmembrane protein n=1 Tax=Schistocephalus solidus TaxID=70667 RepID=A0A183T6Z3_SCHSO|nr:unnamed protein product [Schistocephalus solidus]
MASRCFLASSQVSFFLRLSRGHVRASLVSGAGTVVIIALPLLFCPLYTLIGSFGAGGGDDDDEFSSRILIGLALVSGCLARRAAACV